MRKMCYLGIQSVITLLFITLGTLTVLGKLTDVFKGWGYPATAIYAVGAMGILFGAGAWWQKTAGFSVLALGAVTIAVILTQVGHHEKWIRPLPAIGVFLLVIATLYLKATIRNKSQA